MRIFLGGDPALGPFAGGRLVLGGCVLVMKTFSASHRCVLGRQMSRARGCLRGPRLRYDIAL